MLGNWCQGHEFDSPCGRNSFHFHLFSKIIYIVLLTIVLCQFLLFLLPVQIILIYTSVYVFPYTLAYGGTQLSTQELGWFK